MTLRRMRDLVAFSLLFSGLGISVCTAQEASGPVKAVQLIGLADVKENAKGTLKVENGNLHFVSGKANAEVSATSIQDVVTGADSEKAVGKTIGMISMAAPYGGGRSELIKTALLAQGAHTGEPSAVPASSGNSPVKEEKPALSQERQSAKIKASAIQVEMIQSDEIKLPAEFQVALYEN